MGKGADTDIADRMGHTAAWLAIDAGHTAVKRTIEGSCESTETEAPASVEVGFVTDNSRLPTLFW